jgi:hypothetical protein
VNLINKKNQELRQAEKQTDGQTDEQKDKCNHRMTFQIPIAGTFDIYE